MELLEEIQQKHLLAEIDDGLTKSINEELGIASNVIYATNNLYNRLKEVISKSQSLPFNSDYVVFKKGITEYKDNYINLYVNWNYYNYLNQHSFEKYYRGLNASYTPYNNTLNVNLIATNGTLFEDRIKETIQHELEHYYENKKRNYVPYKQKTDYRNGNRLMSSNNQLEKSIGTILYMSCTFEQRAYANGLYQILMNSGKLRLFKDDVKNSQLYKGLIAVKNSIVMLNSTDGGEINGIIEKIGYNKRKLLDIADETVDGINRIIGRTFVKAQNDLINNGLIHESFNFN